MRGFAGLREKRSEGWSTLMHELPDAVISRIGSLIANILPSTCNVVKVVVAKEL